METLNPALFSDFKVRDTAMSENVRNKIDRGRHDVCAVNVILLFLLLFLREAGMLVMHGSQPWATFGPGIHCTPQ